MSARLGVLATCAAIACWSIPLARRGHVTLAPFGGLAALGLSAALRHDHLAMDVHGVLVVLGVQAAWGAAVAVLLIRGRL